jgi:hypothetical protein
MYAAKIRDVTNGLCYVQASSWKEFAFLGMHKKTRIFAKGEIPHVNMDFCVESRACKVKLNEANDTTSEIESVSAPESGAILPRDILRSLPARASILAHDPFLTS